MLAPTQVAATQLDGGIIGLLARRFSFQRGEASGRRVFAMEIGPAFVDVAVERWQAETGKDAILDGDGRSFAEVRAERTASHHTMVATT